MCFASDDSVVVLSLVPNRAGTGFDLWVLLAVSWGEHGAVRRSMGWLRQAARDMGASRIVFTTIRKGWARVLGPEWQRDSNEYYLEV